MPEEALVKWLEIGLEPVVALIGIVATAIVSIYSIRKQAKLSLAQQARMDIVRKVNESLTLYYNPISFLLRTNEVMFLTYGPPTYPIEHHRMEQAAEVWYEIVKTVINPNNLRIVKIVQNHSHLLAENDDVGWYVGFSHHVHSYTVFTNHPNATHGKHPYPKELSKHVEEIRNGLANRLAFLNDL